MSEELVSNLIHTVYLTLDHNSIVIPYITGFVVCVILSLWKPSRYTLLSLLGFLTLTIGFEYDKHFVGPLVRQTLNSVVGEPGNYVRTTNIITILLGEVLPVIFFVLGWMFIFVAILVGAKRCKKD